MSNDADVTFTTGMTYARDKLFISASPDDDEPHTPYTLWYTYRHNEFDDAWNHIVTRWWAVSCCNFITKTPSGDASVGLSKEGDLYYLFDDLTELTEKIQGAGVNSPDAKNWGYLTSLKQIGEHLYACGYSGQVYKRIDTNNWVHIDQGLLQSPVKAKETGERIALTAIDGVNESAIYAIGYKSADYLPPVVYFYNGLKWSNIKLPEIAERLTAIFIENEQKVWLCGANGTLLLGNAYDGFSSLSTTNDNQLFSSVCRFNETIYLASNTGLFAYDVKNHAKGIYEVNTSLEPKLQDANIVCSEGGVFWSIGTKDIARFDGTQWERIHHRDNAKIGA
jgi:hypothetical protein